MIHPCANRGVYLAVVVYHSPRDYPGQIVARPWVVSAGQCYPDKGPMVIPHEVFERFRALLIDQGFACVPAPEGADPCIVEQWVPAPVLWGEG